MRWTTFSGDAPQNTSRRRVTVCAEAISQFEHALALDPQSVEAQSWLASALTGRVLTGMTDSVGGRHRTRGRAGRASLGGIARATRLRISPKARCCARSAGSRRPFPNTRRCSRPIATRWSHSPLIGRCKIFIGPIDEAIPLRSKPSASARVIPCRLLVFPDRGGASAAIAYRRGDPLARKGAQRQS